MDTLFPLEPSYPDGFHYYPAFISEKEEAGLLEVVRSIELHPFLFQGYEAKRKVASFGYDWSFDKQQLVKGKPIPPAFNWMIGRVAQKLSLPESGIAELLVTEYPVGAVINWHRDAPPFDLIAGVSLNADSTFKLRPHEKTRQVRKSTVSIPLQRRSLYSLQGTARTEWQHSIPAVKQVRYSITLRTLKEVVHQPQ